MKFMFRAVAAVSLALTGYASGQGTPYYITDGDSEYIAKVQGGSIVASSNVFFLGYPMGVGNTVWVGDRDDNGATEYDANTLLPTGNTGVGANNFSQLLDGTSDGKNNYGIECCGGPNSVTIANADWSNQKVLFDLPDGTNGSGIAYDLKNGTLWVSTFDSVVFEYDLAGNILSKFASPAGFIAGLAYEVSTDTLWAYNNGGGDIYQISKGGALLDTINIPGLAGHNNWGGEMPVPAPGCLALLGLGGLAAAGRRR